MLAMSTLKVLRDALERVPSIRLAVMFGSESRGTATARSDIDIGLVFEDGGVQVQQLAVTLERLVHRTVHLVVLNEAPPLLRSEVSRTGTVLIERRPFAWADFRARAMIDWWDWAPTAAMIRRTAAARLREETADGAS
jgi:uncharacterized protein